MQSIFDKIESETRYRRPYPSKIIIGENLFKELVAERHRRGVMGLKVNLKGEYTSLFDMKIEIDSDNKERIEYVD